MRERVFAQNNGGKTDAKKCVGKHYSAHVWRPQTIPKTRIFPVFLSLLLLAPEIHYSFNEKRLEGSVRKVVMSEQAEMYVYSGSRKLFSVSDSYEPTSEWFGYYSFTLGFRKEVIEPGRRASYVSEEEGRSIHTTSLDMAIFFAIELSAR